MSQLVALIRTDVSVLIAALALTVSVASFVFALHKGRYDQIMSIRPAVVFVYDKDGWFAHNLGSGPALNLVVVWREPEEQGGQWVKPVRIPPLKRDGSFAIHWDKHNDTHGLGATYEDMWGRKYTTTCEHDLSRIQPGLTIGGWAPGAVVAEWQLRKVPKPPHQPSG
jgi:hypothetical protein